uniref:Uncharacterized protein n=1 Tax=Fibrocapsa japonica TaxID=94617 RepID=A0A7S2V0V8_9STRA
MASLAPLKKLFLLGSLAVCPILVFGFQGSGLRLSSHSSKQLTSSQLCPLYRTASLKSSELVLKAENSQSSDGPSTKGPQKKRRRRKVQPTSDDVTAESQPRPAPKKKKSKKEADVAPVSFLDNLVGGDIPEEFARLADQELNEVVGNTGESDGPGVGSTQSADQGITPGSYSIMDRELLPIEYSDGVNKGKTVNKKKKKGFNIDEFDPDDIELPVPSERLAGAADLTTSFDKQAEETTGVFSLPDLKDVSARPKKQEAPEPVQAPAKRARLTRSDVEEFRRMTEIEPGFDPSMFDDDKYDLANAVLGTYARPMFGAIDQGYLQAGHTVLLAVVLLCANIEYPGNPLTELPTEIRDFLKTGLVVNYAINAVLAVFSIFKARNLSQPPQFWFGKTLLLGGLAYNELTQAKDAGKFNIKS